MAEQDNATIPEAGPAERFVIVPALPAWRELEERVRVAEQRVAALERRPAATVPVEAPDVAQLLERLDRHRQELDEVKRRYNDLAEFLDLYYNRSTPSPAQPAAPPEGIL